MTQHDGPWPLIGLLGAALGILTALGVHFLASWLRRVAPVPFAIVGWLGIAFMVFLTVLCAYFFVRGQDRSGISLLVACVGFLVLAVVAGGAALHFRRDGVSYPLACGHLAVQFGGAVALCYGLAQILPGFAAWLHGGKPTDSDIVHWFPPVHYAGDWLYGTFLVGLFLLEAFRPFRAVAPTSG